MITSSSISKIAPALLNAQKSIGAAKKGSVNPFFHSKYADLGSVMEACKDALNDNGITVLQPVGTDTTGMYVETVLLHESGEFVSDKYSVNGSDPQKVGSAVSYARRYGLQSMVFIPAEDDDGNTASRPVAKSQSSYNDFDGLLPPDEEVSQPRYIKTPQEATQAVAGVYGNAPTAPQSKAIGAIVLRNPDLNDEANLITNRQEASDFIGKYGYKK